MDFKKYSKRLFFLLAILFVTESRGQNYPVQVSVSLQPPFSGYLPDYAGAGNDNLRVFLLFNDFSLPFYDVKLKIKIEGNGINISSQSWYYDGPINLEPGIPLMLSGSDLAGLLNGNNMSFTGISRQVYDQGKVLPEGFYTISVTAYDFQNPQHIQVSNEGSTQAWMVLNDAPFLNFPSCGSELSPPPVQQQTFSWTCFSQSFSAGTEYTFELWEVFPATVVPGNVVASAAPIFSFVTSQTIFNYGITEPPLVIGREYVWRVRAMEIDNRQLFRNNGYSPICTFTWGSATILLGNLAVLQLSAQALTHRQARCNWDSLGAYDQYRIEYRRASPSANWFSLATNNASLRVTDLEPNTNYEAHVQGIFPDGTPGPWSNTASWHTPTPQQIICGQSSPPPAQQLFQPLTQATPQMIWQVGQFEMTVVSLQSLANSGGWYSGIGKIEMPLGVTLACEFSGIQIGADHVMYSGEVRAITSGITQWLTQYQMTQYHYDTSYFYPGEIDSMFVNANGDLVIINSNGDTVHVEISPGGTLVTDATGSQWIINGDGTIIPVTGEFLLPLTNDTLSVQELRILKMAMTILRNELSPGSISGKQQEMQTKKSSLENYATTQRQNLPIPATPGAGLSADTNVTVFYSESTGAANDQGFILGKAYKTSEVDYYSARVLLVMAREDAPDTELHFIGQYLTVNGVAYRSFVAQQLSQGKTETQVAADVAEHGVKKLVVLVLKKQM
ncbi:MAG TPA: fibronectin type III domain-containing protein, partial [Bacteroidia bacterium]|nr:fibronectin type III domain-containing protein [Bacteroidia bacterium]